MTKMIFLSLTKDRGFLSKSRGKGVNQFITMRKIMGQNPVSIAIIKLFVVMICPCPWVKIYFWPCHTHGFVCGWVFVQSSCLGIGNDWLAKCWFDSGLGWFGMSVCTVILFRKWQWLIGQVLIWRWFGMSVYTVILFRHLRWLIGHVLIWLWFGMVWDECLYSHPV